MIKACITTIPKKIWNNKIAEKKTIGWICERYKQPEWCSYPDALDGLMGCWALISVPYKINEKKCKKCDLFKKEK